VALALIYEAEAELTGNRKHEIVLDAAAALVHSFAQRPTTHVAVAWAMR
jgi:hypothetical protein